MEPIPITNMNPAKNFVDGIAIYGNAGEGKIGFLCHIKVYSNNNPQNPQIIAEILGGDYDITLRGANCDGTVTEELPLKVIGYTFDWR